MALAIMNCRFRYGAAASDLAFLMSLVGCELPVHVQTAACGLRPIADPTFSWRAELNIYRCLAFRFLDRYCSRALCVV